MNRKITSWLDTHIDVNDLIPHLGSKEIDIDALPKAPSDTQATAASRRAMVRDDSTLVSRIWERFLMVILTWLVFPD
jgi:hypothetical protein